MRRICLGNGLLLLCSLFYLAWWILAFKPGNMINGIGTKILLLVASICGVTALILTIVGTRSLPQSRIYISNSTIMWGGIIVYACLLVFTYGVLKRQVTSELFLIVGWGVLELFMINGLYGAEQISHGAIMAFILLIAIVIIISLYCYVQYYCLDGMAGYIDGMVPLLLVAIVMIILEVKCIDFW